MPIPRVWPRLAMRDYVSSKTLGKHPGTWRAQPGGSVGGRAYGAREGLLREVGPFTSSRDRPAVTHRRATRCGGAGRAGQRNGGRPPGHTLSAGAGARPPRGKRTRLCVRMASRPHQRQPLPTSAGPAARPGSPLTVSAVSAAFWCCVSITAISALVSLGYSIAALAGSRSSPDRTPSMYAFARSLALAAGALAAVVVRSVSFAEAIAFLMVIVQGADAVIGTRIGDRLKTIGPAATALFNAAALVWLAQQ